MCKYITLIISLAPLDNASVFEWFKKTLHFFHTLQTTICINCCLVFKEILKVFLILFFLGHVSLPSLQGHPCKRILDFNGIIA